MTSKLNFKKISTVIIVAVTIFLLCYISLPNIKDFYYWKDDWVMLWSNKLSPSTMFLEIGGQGWPIKSGLLFIYYTRLFGSIPREILQSSGIFLKFFNSLVVIALIYQLTKNKSSAILSGFLFAVFSGAAEMYTWHRPTALAAGLIYLAIVFHERYISKFKLIFFLGTLLCISLAMLTYFGRVIGIFPGLIVSNIIHFIYLPNKRLFREIVFLVGISLLLVITTAKTVTYLTRTQTSSVLADSFKHTDIFISNLGNMLRVPFFKLPEAGGLVGSVSHSSLIIGELFLVLGIAIFVIFLITRSKFWQLLCLIWMWTIIMYIPNWLYAPGGVITMIASTSRYFAISAWFFPLFFGIVISKLNRILQILVFLPLFMLSLNYSMYVINIENSIRNKDIVAQIYQKVVADTQSDPLPRVLVIDTTKSNLTSGWFPYAYAYFKGIKSRTDFPTVFTNESSAREWLCAPEDQKALISSKYGAPDNQSGHPVLKSRIHSWRVAEDGTTTDTTTSFLNGITDCVAE